MRRTPAIALAMTAFTLTLLASVDPADAHVTVTAADAVEGGTDTVITFRVPTESDTASTTGLKVRLPTDTPLLGVLVQPVPGWTFKVIQAKLAHPVSTDDGPVTQAVAEIDWTATSGGVGPGGFEEFNVIAGQLPKTSTLTFKAIQHYSNDTNVAWVEVAGPGAAEPDHPAPTLTLKATSAAAAPSATPTTAAPMDMSSTTTEGGASTTAVVIAIALAAAGIVLGAAGLLLAYTTRRRAHEPTAAV